MKRTPWFKADERDPVWLGPYEVYGLAIPSVRMLNWNGRQWGEWIETRGGPRWRQISFGNCPGDYWRGLARPAE